MAMLLIIEDEAVLARNVARFFEKLGHTVEVATTARPAWRRRAASCPTWPSWTSSCRAWTAWR
jgi:DNA-binding response OmpR family regulator